MPFIYIDLPEDKSVERIFDMAQINSHLGLVLFPALRYFYLY